MRKAPTALILGLAVPAFGALPVLGAPHAAARPVTPQVRSAAHPVTPQVRSAALVGVDAAALHGRPGAASAVVAASAAVAATATGRRPVRLPRRPAVLTGPRRAGEFELLGVTWRSGAPAADLAVVVRARAVRAAGASGWGAWTALEHLDDPSAHDAAGREGSEPLWVGASDAYQVRIDLLSGRRPRGLRVDLVSPGDSPADAAVGPGRPAASAAAAVSPPMIHSRAAWGADERLRSSGPRYSSTIKAGFVHHTAGTNHYPASDVPKIIRGIYAYHTKANGWSDIGYNFLVDRFGRLWEGRYGGVDRPVLGAHTGGFNVDSFAVSAIGDYQTAAAPAAMVDAIARLLAWKLALHFRNPKGRTTLQSTGGGTSRYPAGARVRFHVVSGHRDAGYTECPGGNLYRALPTIRARTLGYVGAGLVRPTASARRVAFSRGRLTVGAGTLRTQHWSLKVRDRCRGTVVRTISGTASPGSPIAVTWDLRDSAGTAVRPAAYDLSLSSWTAASTARTWRHRVTVDGPSTAPSRLPAAPLPGATTFVPLDPTRIFHTRTGGRRPLGAGQRRDLAVTGVAGVPSTGVGAVALTFTASCASDPTYLTAWPAGARRPAAPALHLDPGATRSALVVAAVGGNGRVSLANHAGSVELAVDVAGYYATAPPPAPGAGQTFHPVRAFRLFDSRQDRAGILAGGTGRTLTVPALGGAQPGQAAAVVVNLTSIAARGAGTLTVHRPGGGLGAATSASYSAGTGSATRAVATLGTGGRLRVDARGSATQAVVDVVGWYGPATVTGGRTFRPVIAKRLLDTRTGRGARKGRLGRHSLTFAVAGAGRALPAGTAAVVMNLTSVGATSATVVTARPAGSRPTSASDLNVARGVTTSNLVVVRLGTGTHAGRLTLSNTSGRTHLVGDVVGYYR